MKKFLNSKNLTLILTFVGLFLISTGASVAIFSYLREEPGNPIGSSKDIGGSRSKITPDMPKTEECPINGRFFTKVEKNIWEARRPITAMIENHADSRPPSGLSKADFVYEAVAEGGITRFLGVFFCNATAEEVKIAPVRSARVYFINFASEYGDKPIYMHVGGANNYCKDCPGGVKTSGTIAKEVRALELLETIGWRVPGGNDFDTVYDSGYPVFWRNYERLEKEVATEHTMMASLDAAYKQAEKRNLTDKDAKGVRWDKKFTQYKFIDGKPASTGNGEISFAFWDNKSDYDVTWKYDAGSNLYKRFNGGKEHIDLENKEQLSASNIAVMFTEEKAIIDKEGHAFYNVIGTGKALVFQNGEAIDATWTKTARESRTLFKDKNGKEISFVRGVTWVEVLPKGNTVNY